MKVYHGSHIRIDFFLQGKNISEVVATDLFYTSKTFAQLANESTGLHLKPWQEIYELLKYELQQLNS